MIVNMNDPFAKELKNLLNRHSIDNLLGTPDYILAKYVLESLFAFANAQNENTEWHNNIKRHYEDSTDEKSSVFSVKNIKRYCF